MHDCLKTARHLEAIAVEVDGVIKQRDEKLAQLKTQHGQRLAAVEKAHQARLEAAKQERVALKTQAHDELSRFEGLVKTTVEKTNSLLPYKPPTNNALSEAVPPETAANLAGELENTAHTVSAGVNGLALYNKNNVAIGSVIAVGVLIALLPSLNDIGEAFASVVGQWMMFLSLLTLILIHYLSWRSTFKAAYNKFVTTAQTLRTRAQWEYEQAAQQADATYQAKEKNSTTTFQAEKQGLEKRDAEETARTRATAQQRIDTLRQQMQMLHEGVSQQIETLNNSLICGPLKNGAWSRWQPADGVPGCLRLGTIEPLMPRFRHQMPNLMPISIPALVDYEAGKGIVILADQALKEARGMAQSAILRLLATVPPAGVRFVFIDPVSLGGNVAGFMALEKYEANLIGGKAWSDARHIEQALAEVTDHMETVIQKYLREDYKSIAEYNATARVKEAYRVIVAFDFPVNFSETAAKRLVSIMRNGPRCGVFPFVIVDRSKPLPYGFNLSDLQQFALVIQPGISVKG
jgi:hypothetical protein